MNEPSVTAVCLTADRQDFTDRAVRCFLRQTYPNKHLLIYDNGKVPYKMERVATSQITLVRVEPRGSSIGELRNEANALVKSDVIMHWDSDDISEPERMSVHVRELQASGNNVIGSYRMLFWNSVKSEAWMYANDAVFSLGTSLCYSRWVWEHTPFEHRGRGEDLTWGRKVGVSKLAYLGMIAEIHKGNPGIQIVPGSREWTRREDLDLYCRKVVEEA